MIGLKRGTVKLIKYNPKWKYSFENEVKKLIKVFDKGLIDIQHVGSTAIKGIFSKPIIDIGVVVSSFNEVKKYIEKLNGIGYEFKKDDVRSDRLFFTKGSEEKRTHYLHIGEKDGGYIEDMILFRDYLNSNKKAAEEYSKLKKELAVKYEDVRYKYSAGKEKFINEIMKKCHGK